MLQQLLRKVRYLGWSKCEVDLKSASFLRMMTYLDVLTIFFLFVFVFSHHQYKNQDFDSIIFSGFASIFILLKTSMMFLATKLMYFHLIHLIYRPPKPSWVRFGGFHTSTVCQITMVCNTFPKNDLKLMTWKKIILPNHIGIIINQYKDPYLKKKTGFNGK